MATELDALMHPQRRALLQAVLGLAAGCALPGVAAAAATPSLAAAWALAQGQQVGLLAAQGGLLAVRAALDVPTRAHGLLVEANGAVLAVARRPGDWLLRWHPATHEAQWAWIEPDRAYNGHVVASADGRRLYTTETHLATGAGLIGVRDAVSLEKQAEWPTHGMDPHELLLDKDGSLIVANGGIPTLPETGRIKVGLERMDPSLVRLHTGSGALLGQWRLPDPRLSLRHMAGGPGRTLGIALQAEHEQAAQRTAAPVFALFDGQALRTATAPQPLAGYGGAIAHANGLFAVSCPRAQGVALYDSAGRWQGLVPLAQACALASTPAGALWAGGSVVARSLADAAQLAVAPTLRLDNHWLHYPA